MSDSGFYKCACENCQGHLEFPAHAAGVTTTCPHCGVETRLVAPEGKSAEATHQPPPPPPAAPPPPPPPPPPAPPGPSVAPAQAAEPKPAAPAQAETGSAAAKLKRVLSVVWSVLIGLGVVIGVGWKVWRTVRKTGSVVEAVKSDAKSAPSERTRVPTSTPAPPPPPAAPPTSIVLATGTPPARKAGEDLQVTGFEIHKAKDGNLQYIVGVVTNHSARQYFNVRLEFALTRAGGKAGDTATDTLRNLPANVGSTFKVNIIGTTPVNTAQLVKLEGEKE